MSLPSPSIASSDATLVPSSSAYAGGQHGSAGNENINVQIYVPEYNVQKCIQAHLGDTVWEVKQKILALLPKDMQEGFNYGLFLPPCNGRAGKFLLEERPLRDYPFQDCVPYLELKYKKRVYKMLNLDEKALKQLHTKSTLKKFLEYVEERQAEKVEKLCSQGVDPNFHDSTGETPLTIAASVDDNKHVLLALTSGGAHLDFRNLEGQTPLHKAAFLCSHSNVKTLLELGASPNYKDPLGLTPLYYCMLKGNTNPNTAELLLRDYSELGVTDPHGNQEVHQACKNDLMSHLEHLLFYGTEINCQNVNGNTPLHVCAVNNQEACARVLLFRGSDPNIVNNQGQTAYHVAVITGHHGVAELIRTHDPSTAVPYRGMPRYNSKRRLARPPGSSSAMVRTRSIGSMAASECGYGTLRGAVLRAPGVRPVSEMGRPSPGLVRQPCLQYSPMEQHYGLPFPAQAHRGLHHTLSAMPAFSGRHTMLPECRPALVKMIKKSVSEQNAAAAVGLFATVRGSMDGVMTGTIQRVVPEMATQLAAPAVMNNDVNIPRILVIPRGPKGFGFILRGAKKVDNNVTFEPTPETPALQYFEGVDMNGMAMKAGLKPGDFLLEINGTDVRCASHDQVVRLIQLSGDTISLKVITIDPSEPLPPVPYYGTLRRNSKAAPPPPSRHPGTSLSIATGRNAAAYQTRYDEYAAGGSMPRGQPQPRSVVYPNATMGAAKSSEHIAVAYRDPRDKVASVRGRVNSRRISAAELEQLMARQNSNGSSSCSFSTDLESPGTPNSVRNSNSGAPKVYNSVAEMKRQKLQRSQPPRGNIGLVEDGGSSSTTLSNGGLKSFHSSPDLQGSVLSLARNYADEDGHQQEQAGDRRQIYEPDHKHYYSSTAAQRVDKAAYGAPAKVVQRPKTPPPAPPIHSANRSANGHAPPAQPGRSAPAPPASHPRTYQDDDSYGIYYSRRGHDQQMEQPHIPEPDYDDPAVETCPSAVAGRAPLTAAAPPPPPPPPPPVAEQPRSDFKSALMMKRQHIMNQTTASREETSSSASQASKSKPENSRSSGKDDFNSDLRNAIARRRTQLDHQHSNGINADDSKQATDPKADRFVGLSLRESVQNNIQTTAAPGGKKSVGFGNEVSVAPMGKSGKTVARHGNSPNGFANKKDSGFSSSRNSLEPSECEDAAVATETSGREKETAVFSNEDMLRQHRVSFLSHQLEDTIGGSQSRGRLPHAAVVKRTSSSTDQQDAISLASTLSTLSGCSDATGSSAMSQQAQQAEAYKDSIPPMPEGPPPAPPPDYDAADSGTGDSENDDVTPTLSQQNLAHQSNSFRSKSLSTWSVSDVCDWLDSLYLSEYKRGFSRSNVDGRRLLNCDRTQFTQLGVTRIAHRIAMENSLKLHKDNRSNTSNQYC